MQHRPSAEDGNDLRFPDNSLVITPYPLTPEQEHGDRAGWPWLPGWIVCQCGPDEWQVCVQDPALAVMDDGTIPPPGTPDEECNFPVVFRDASELRPASPAVEDMRAIFPESGDEPGPHDLARAGTSAVCIVCGKEHAQ